MINILVGYLLKKKRAVKKLRRNDEAGPPSPLERE